MCITKYYLNKDFPVWTSLFPSITKVNEQCLIKTGANLYGWACNRRSLRSAREWGLIPSNQLHRINRTLNYQRNSTAGMSGAACKIQSFNFAGLVSGSEEG